MFNAERLYDEAGELREARLDSVPDETASSPGPEERAKYDKVIEKGSRVLERFPKNKKRTAEAVFLIGESFRHKGEWGKAIIKYDEYERYFADYDSMRAVEYQRAYCLYRNNEFNISRFALEPVISDKKHPYYFQGLNLLSLLDEKSEFPDQAIAALEAVLAPNLRLMKRKLLEGSMQSNMTGLLCYQNLSEQCAKNVPKEASGEAGRHLRETERQGRRAETLMLGHWLPL
jgi:hypothetical protein